MPAVKPESITLEQTGRAVTVTLHYAQQNISFSFNLEPPAPAGNGLTLLDLDNLQAVTVNGNTDRPGLIQALRETQVGLVNELDVAKRERDFLRGGGRLGSPDEQEQVLDV